MIRVDVYAGEGHFLDHLVPVWAALPPWARGEVLVSEEVGPAALAAGLPATVVDPGQLAVEDRPTIVAAWGDFRKLVDRRPLILGEHGAGQTYGNRHPSYAGGIGRDRARLFLVPNASASRRNRARYPRIPTAIVGSPKIDLLRQVPEPMGVRTAVVSFHWRCKVSPETDTALDHFAPVLATARAELLELGIRLLGHAHPRILEEATEVFDSAGMETLGSFEEVVERAHVYAVDNSSTLFEFAALGRPVVVLNAPGYRKNVQHGLRFWDAATVGPQVDRPQDFAAAVARSFSETEEDRRSRERALARVYPVRDGTSSIRAAKAVLDVVAPGRCFVCGEAHSSCGPTTDVVPVDQRVSSPMNPGPLKRYPNPNGRGFLRLSDDDARRRGLVPQVDAPAPVPPAAPDGVPKGAIPPGGPTARARAAKAAASSSSSEETTPAEDGEAKQKKRPTPTNRRRRPAPAAE